MKVITSICCHGLSACVTLIFPRHPHDTGELGFSYMANIPSSQFYNILRRKLKKLMKF